MSCLDFKRGVERWLSVSLRLLTMEEAKTLRYRGERVASGMSVEGIKAGSR